MKMRIKFLLTILAIIPTIFSSTLYNNAGDDSSVENDPYYAVPNRYCRVRTCPDGSHTMCRYPDPGTHSKCGHVIRSGLEHNEVQLILQLHNNLRSCVFNGNETRGDPGPQPPAVRDVPLVWDSELEMFAERWVNQCQISYDLCRNVDDYIVGQNYAEQQFNGSMDEKVQLEILEELIYSWYNEVELFDRFDLGSYRDYSDLLTTSYTQMIWANTTRIGCSAIRYQEFDEYYPTIFFLCNYGPSGNIEGKPVYEVSDWRFELNDTVSFC